MLNIILVQILKVAQELAELVSDICDASKASESICRNNIIILKLLAEEVFEFAQEYMTRAKMQHLKNSISSEFSSVFELCLLVLTNTNNSLLKPTPDTLLQLDSTLLHVGERGVSLPRLPLHGRHAQVTARIADISNSLAGKLYRESPTSSHVHTNHSTTLR